MFKCELCGYLTKDTLEDTIAHDTSCASFLASISLKLIIYDIERPYSACICSKPIGKHDIRYHARLITRRREILNV